jgi:hypothetical protein
MAAFQREKDRAILLLPQHACSLNAFLTRVEGEREQPDTA